MELTKRRWTDYENTFLVYRYSQNGLRVPNDTLSAEGVRVVNEHTSFCADADDGLEFATTPAGWWRRTACWRLWRLLGADPR